MPLLPFSYKTLHLTEPDSSAFSTTPNDFGFGLTGQVSVLERSTLHVDEGQQTQASIKEKVSKLEEGGGKNGQKSRASHPTSRKKTPGVKTP